MRLCNKILFHSIRKLQKEYIVLKQIILRNQKPRFGNYGNV